MLFSRKPGKPAHFGVIGKVFQSLTLFGPYSGKDFMLEAVGVLKGVSLPVVPCSRAVSDFPHVD